MSSRKRTNSQGNATTSAGWWSPLRRGIVSGLLMFHLFAVVAAPLSGPPPSSELSRAAAGVVQWYIRAMFLGHGYRFFAPNPGPSHVVRYELVMADGSIEKGQFPDRHRDWPRLLYHRHFMVSETINGLASIPTREEFEAEMELGAQDVKSLSAAGHRRQARRLRERLESDRAGYEAAAARQRLLIKAIAEHLMREHDAVGIRMTLHEHLIPNPLDVETGADLNDDRYWQSRPLVEFHEESL